jgi:hypothetical protein
MTLVAAFALAGLASYAVIANLVPLMSERGISTGADGGLSVDESGQPGNEIGDTRGDVIPDEAHAFDAVDTAVRGFVGVPILELCFGDWFDARFTAQGDDDVDVPNDLGVDRFWDLVAYVHTYFGEYLRREPIEGSAGCGAGGVDLHPVPGDLSHQSGGHLRLAGVLDADEQNGGTIGFGHRSPD